MLFQRVEVPVLPIRFGLTRPAAVLCPDSPGPRHPRGLAGMIHPRRCALRCKYSEF
nr:MAG TPA: hypothetical protein [Caudoviricetes sp.]DAL73072.1 MAG TPA: hypothetical protein [Caudoviricetes sp.]